MTNCSHKESGRDCPISKTPCLGECIYANILDDINLGIIGLDIKGQEVFFQNKLAIEIFKGTIHPKDYQALISLLLPDFEKCLAANNFNVARTLSYGTKFIGYTIYCISDMYLWVYVSDITEKTRLNAIAEAVDTMNNFGYIFSGIRHELGNPINSIKTTMTVLRNNIGSYSRETVLEYIERVLSDINRVEYILRDLKTFSMYETPDIKNVHLPSYMNNLIQMAERDFSRQGIRIKTIFRPDVGLGYLDPRALQQVMLNILTNAADALEGRDSPEISISMYKTSDRIIIKVKDNGCGISEENRRFLFKPFSTTKSTGTGLGLVIAKKMLSKMDGTIDIESREHAGTEVVINLPEGRDSVGNP